MAFFILLAALCQELISAPRFPLVQLLGAPTAGPGPCRGAAAAVGLCRLGDADILPFFFDFFSHFRLKYDDKLKILPWAVCRACGLLQWQHLPGRAPDPVLGQHWGEAPAGTEVVVPPRPPRPHSSLLKVGVKALGSSPQPWGLWGCGCCAPAGPF